MEFDATLCAGAATRRALEAQLLERVQDDELELLMTAAARARTLDCSSALRRVVSVSRCATKDRVSSAHAPPPRTAKGGGFGLVVVDRIATRWGVARDAGSCVWFELDR